MGRALELAAEAAADGDIPVGAVVVDATGEIIGEGRNTRERDGDPTGHAEVVAMRAAAVTKGEWRLTGCTLVVTLEPCPMCAGAVVASRVPRVVLGAWDTKMGACGSVWDVVRDRRSIHRAEVIGGVREGEAAQLLVDFFGERREGLGPWAG
ncbi:CMP deaminase [Janibacter sp. Soil728]|uniref:nucleoside deaminase n=1 Tax=Janibacter sp. Soil728 TaxID=1736393 RepID=UPI0006F2B5D8|nr:nucleoside deaminase [Janibacter sp. Soil728]KRE39508.1 CMP deaminase [Janibacter sp. Soil728]